MFRGDLFFLVRTLSCCCRYNPVALHTSSVALLFPVLFPVLLHTLFFTLFPVLFPLCSPLCSLHFFPHSRLSHFLPNNPVILLWPPILHPGIMDDGVGGGCGEDGV